MVEHCLSESVVCLINQRCRDAIVCDEKCSYERMGHRHNSKKFHIQNCSVHGPMLMTLIKIFFVVLLVPRINA
jgi:hypothetical protein